MLQDVAVADGPENLVEGGSWAGRAYKRRQREMLGLDTAALTQASFCWYQLVHVHTVRTKKTQGSLHRNHNSPY